jgi:hypothetical protein
VTGYAEREKSGLPRLMEALESNMWSTMRKRTTPRVPAAELAQVATAPTSVADPTAAPSSLEAEKESSSAGGTGPDTSAAGAVLSSTEPPGAEQTQSSHQRALEVDPFELEMEDKEDNEIVDKYSDFINEVRSAVRTMLR